jgi:hypothetical protein
MTTATVKQHLRDDKRLRERVARRLHISERTVRRYVTGQLVSRASAYAILQVARHELGAVEP